MKRLFHPIQLFSTNVLPLETPPGQTTPSSKHRSLRRQRGSSRIGNLLSLLIFAALMYAAARTGPLFLERYRIDSLAQKAANQWMNVTPNLEMVKRDMQHELEVQHIDRVAADDFTYTKPSEHEVIVSVTYSVSIHHPYNVLKPTPIKFHIERRARHRVELDQ